MSDLIAAENIIAQLTPKQKERLSEIHGRVRLELAKEFGDKLAPVIVESLLRSTTTNTDVVAELEGIKDCLPVSDAAWRSFAKRLVARDELAQRNLSFRQATKKAELRGAELAKMPPAMRMQLARTGQLDTLCATNLPLITIGERQLSAQSCRSSSTSMLQRGPSNLPFARLAAFSLIGCRQCRTSVPFARGANGPLRQDQTFNLA